MSGPAGVVPGDELIVVERVAIDGHILTLPAELPGVPEYIAAARSEAEADGLRPALTMNLAFRGDVPHQPDTRTVFGFYAAAGSAVTAAIAGLEGFANHHIARLAGAADAVDYAGRPYTRRELWDLPLNERLGDVLPALGCGRSPKQTPWWTTFRRVQGLAALSRHGITQPVTRRGLVGEKSMVQRYCDREYEGAAGMMLDAYTHFEPQWLDAERRDQLPPPPNT